MRRAATERRSHHRGDGGDALPRGQAIRLDFAAGPDVDQIHGDIWAGDAAQGSPIESFTLTGNARAHVSERMRVGRYYLLARIGWSRLGDSGDTGYAFRVEIVPP